MLSFQNQILSPLQSIFGLSTNLLPSPLPFPLAVTCPAPFISCSGFGGKNPNPNAFSLSLVLLLLSMENSSEKVMKLKATDATPISFEEFGQVIEASPDGEEFGPSDAQLDLSRGIPRRPFSSFLIFSFFQGISLSYLGVLLRVQMEIKKIRSTHHILASSLGPTAEPISRCNWRSQDLDGPSYT